MANVWKDEELCLALELYLRKGKSEWLKTINDETWEIVTLSAILKGLDYAPQPVAESYRSTGSIRLKLANICSIDPDYGNAGMGNGSKGDKRIWEMYADRYNELSEKCKKIIYEHYCGTFDAQVKEYISLMGEIGNYTITNFYDYCNEVKDTLIDMRQRLINDGDKKENIKTINDCHFIIRCINNVLDGQDVTKDNNEFDIHAGINQLPVDKQQRSEMIPTKIGRHVQETFKKLIEDNKVTQAIINDLLDATYSRNTFRINHPFLVKLDPAKDLFDQMRDERGYVRYYTKPIEIDKQQYGLCKEWYERQRKYYDRWLELLYNDRAQKSQKARLIKYLLEVDREKPFIKKNDIINDFSDIQAIDLVIDELLEMQVLRYVNGDKSKVCIDDFETAYMLINNPDELRKKLGE